MGVFSVSEKITQKELESYLKGATTLLRGLIDASDYKQYIFPLLFYKRLCDVWDEDYSLAFSKTNDIDFATSTANDRFLIPSEYSWRNLRNSTKNLGQLLVRGFREIETKNDERLSGIFGNASWTDKEQMPDVILKNLIEHFSSIKLDISTVPEDELGNGYEYLIKHFADDSGNTAQEFYTNRTLVHLMAQMLKPQTGESIYDPTCGTGGMLISALSEVKRLGGDVRTIGLFGQELINITAAIAKMNLVLHGVSDFEIKNGNTLHKPLLIQDDQLRKFDIVLANPPYSIKTWNQEAWSSDQWGRNFLGTPPQGRADYAFFQHILKSLKSDTGRCAILFSHGVLFRKEEAELRRKLVESDVLECVLGLGPNLFYNSPMEACVVICRFNKSENQKGKVLFIDAVNEYEKQSSQTYLSPVNQSRILQAYEQFQDISLFAKVSDISEILANNGNLTIHHYVDRGDKVFSNDSEISVTDLWLRNEKEFGHLNLNIDSFMLKSKQNNGGGDNIS
jgi:type I restriction enzyme M protein